MHTIRSFTFSTGEREYILNSDLALTEVGLMLVEKAVQTDGCFHLACSDLDYRDFLQAISDELAYRGFRPEENDLRALSARIGVSNLV